ncbi:MAG: signal recognition particle receptor subunit alpha, partial [Christensenellales bacterium]
MGIFSKFFNALKKTKDAISKKISQIFVGELDNDFYEELEFILVSSDIGVDASHEIVDNVKKLAKKEKIKTEEDFKIILRKAMAELLTFDEKQIEYPALFTIVGVNGVGKTTAIGKLAHNYKKNKKSVLMVAGDTFRASASDQLNEWSKRAGV